MAVSNKSDESMSATMPCGVVMPISAIDGCSEQHWLDIKEIIFDAIVAAGLKPSLVSDSDDVGIIQKRIIQNLYQNPIIVCDVSGKNPIVMFELGMRLAFDRPAIIVKDDKTSYSFDTSPIEHLEYPRDLRFSKIVTFKSNLCDKIRGTLERSKADPTYTTFLKHFGAFTVAKLETKEVSKEDFIIEELRDIRKLILRSDTTEGPRSAVSRQSLAVSLIREEIVDLLNAGNFDEMPNGTLAKIIEERVPSQLIRDDPAFFRHALVSEISRARQTTKSSKAAGNDGDATMPPSKIAV